MFCRWLWSSTWILSFSFIRFSWEHEKVSSISFQAVCSQLFVESKPFDMQKSQSLYVTAGLAQVTCTLIFSMYEARQVVVLPFCKSTLMLISEPNHLNFFSSTMQTTKSVPKKFLRVSDHSKETGRGNWRHNVWQCFRPHFRNKSSSYTHTIRSMHLTSTPQVKDLIYSSPTNLMKIITNNHSFLNQNWGENLKKTTYIDWRNQKY